MKKHTEIKVAVADDHAILRTGIISTLKEYSISVAIEAANGLDLIKRLESISVVPDICILDIGMPVLDGYDTINILNNRWPEIKTLVFTSLHNRHSLIKMLSFGARGYLLKQTDISELYNAVCQINDVGFYQSELEVQYLSKAAKNINEFKQEILNPQELLFVRYCCTELTYKEIANKMNLSVRTIDSYRNDLFMRLKLKSRIGLVMYALGSGVLPKE